MFLGIALKRLISLVLLVCNILCVIEYAPSDCFIERFRAAVSVLIGPCCPALLESYSCKGAYCCIIGQIKWRWYRLAACHQECVVLLLCFTLIWTGVGANWRVLRTRTPHTWRGGASRLRIRWVYYWANKMMMISLGRLSSRVRCVVALLHAAGRHSTEHQRRRRRRMNGVEVRSHRRTLRSHEVQQLHEQETNVNYLVRHSHVAFWNSSCVLRYACCVVSLRADWLATDVDAS